MLAHNASLTIRPQLASESGIWKVVLVDTVTEFLPDKSVNAFELARMAMRQYDDWRDEMSRVISELKTDMPGGSGKTAALALQHLVSFIRGTTSRCSADILHAAT